MKKRFVGYDAQGTDGSDPRQMVAIFEVLDDDGFTNVVKIPADKADGREAEDAALVTDVDEKPAAEVVDVTAVAPK